MVAIPSTLFTASTILGSTFGIFIFPDVLGTGSKGLSPSPLSIMLIMLRLKTPGHQFDVVAGGNRNELNKNRSVMVSKARIFINRTYLNKNRSVMVSKAAQASPIVRLYTNCVGVKQWYD